MKEEEMDGNEQSGQEKKKVQMCFKKGTNKKWIKNQVWHVILPGS